MVPRLILIATPIGNLGDVSRRTAEALAAADVVACEDTRQTAKLLTHLGISKPLVVYADHNEAAASGLLERRLLNGETVALVTDGGAPLISDPGFAILRRALDAGVAVDYIPGPSAVHAALALSGLPPYPYAFLGFLPNKALARRRFLERYAGLDMTTVLFVSPHRVGAELAAARDAWGDRTAALARELTKKFQELIRGPLSALAREATKRQLKGEMTLVVSGAETASGEDVGRAVRLAADLAAAGLAPSRAAAEAARTFGVAKQTVYAAMTAKGAAPR